MIRATIILVSLSIALGCGKKEPVQPSATNTEATKPEPTNEVKTPPAIPKGINQTSLVKIGTVLWEFKTGNGVGSPAIGSDGTVYVGSLDNKLYAIKTESLGLAKSPWPMRGQNPQHTGRAPAK
jgi:hypothetical protein